jgi:hypothetical protein
MAGWDSIAAMTSGARSASWGLMRKFAGMGFELRNSVMEGSLRRERSYARASSLLM